MASFVVSRGASVVTVAFFALGCGGGGGGGGGGKAKPELPSLDEKITTRFPAPGSTSCPDASLRITFATEPVLGAAGKIQVFDAAAPDMPVAEVDLAVPATWDGVVGGRLAHLGKPVFVDGANVLVYLPSGKLDPEHTYYVNIEQGVFVDAEGNSLGGISGSEAWRFTTVTPAPAVPGELSVSLDGTADYCSVQGALDSVPFANTSRVTITVRPGLYREMLRIVDKGAITLRGEDRETTVIAYANNENLNPGTHGRPMVNCENANDLVFENMTFHNLTPQDGSQAEALRVEPGERVILRDANFLSLQDTLLLSGHVYVTGSYIEGNVDYIWGKGAVFFEDTEIKTVGRPGYNVQARNSPTLYGYVFVNSRLTAGDGIAGEWLARVDVEDYPGSMVAYIDCEMSSAINPVGWTITPLGAEAPVDLRFWEFGSVDPNGDPVDVSRRAPFSKQLTEEEAAPLRDPVTVLGWDPAG